MDFWQGQWDLFPGASGHGSVSIGARPQGQISQNSKACLNVAF